MRKMLILMVLLPSLLPGALRGQSTGAPADAALEARVREVASQLRCVVCQGVSIQDSPTELAIEMKSIVREQLAEGRTAEEVKEYFVSKYGEWILLEPRARGFNLIVYLLPVAALLVGGGVVATSVRRWSRNPVPPIEDRIIS